MTDAQRRDYILDMERRLAAWAMDTDARPPDRQSIDDALLDLEHLITAITTHYRKPAQPRYVTPTTTT